MRYVAIASLVAAFLAPVAVQAQDASPTNVAGTFAGFRVEGNIGWDKTEALGRNNEKFGYGGSAGFDGNLTNRIVIGPEVTYWRPNNNRNSVSAPIVGGGTLTQEGREMWSGDIRIGYRLDPNLLLFGKGGYVNQKQRTYLNAAGGGLISASTARVGGYQYGGGIQYAPHDRFSFAPASMYVSAQYVRSRFDNRTRDQHAMAGIGFRFR